MQNGFACPWLIGLTNRLCVTGMGKEVENLISENTELLATKYVYFDSNRSTSNPYKIIHRIHSVFQFNF